MGALRGSGRTSSGNRERHRTRNTLVVVQVALALVLLVASGLMIRTSLALRAVPPGFTDPDSIQLVRLAIPTARTTEPGQLSRMQRDMRDRVAAIPGVQSASFTNSPPLTDSANDAVFSDDQASADAKTVVIRRFKFVAPGFFQTAGIRLVVGRDLTWSDLENRRPVAIVSENLAREKWREPAAALG
jgi:hypothetical protein